MTGNDWRISSEVSRLKLHLETEAYEAAKLNQVFLSR